jgi:hypothetical protein
MNAKVKVTERRLGLHTGTEGTWHDPYSYRELTVFQNGHVVMFHTGLFDFLKVDGEKVMSGDYSKCVLKFEQLTGLNEYSFMRAYDRLNRIDKCPNCNCRSFMWVQGFPGERLLMCNKCHEIIDSEFIQSQII